MKLTVVQLIQLGQKYLALWPNKPELTQYFQDYRSVQSARFVCRYFPALALFTFIMQIYVASGYPLGQGSFDNVITALPQALVYGLFLVSIPVQALVFSGVKADQFLPPSLASWYQSAVEKVKLQVIEQDEHTQSTYNQSENNTIANLPTNKPRYIDLAQLLQLTFASSK